MNTKHTPTPWRVVRRSNQTGVCGCWLTNDRVTFEPIRGTPNAELGNRAALMDAIAATLNAHDELVAALRAAERLAWEVGSETEDGIKTLCADSRGDLYRQITSALAKMKE